MVSLAEKFSAHVFGLKIFSKNWPHAFSSLSMPPCSPMPMQCAHASADLQVPCLRYACCRCLRISRSFHADHGISQEFGGAIALEMPHRYAFYAYEFCWANPGMLTIRSAHAGNSSLGAKPLKIRLLRRRPFTEAEQKIIRPH